MHESWLAPVPSSWVNTGRVAEAQTPPDSTLLKYLRLALPCAKAAAAVLPTGLGEIVLTSLSALELELYSLALMLMLALHLYK